MLYGPSGVGKSSLLHAGVVHRLREQARPEPGEEDDEKPRTAVVILDDWTGDPVSRLAAKIRALNSDVLTAPEGGAPPGEGTQELMQAVSAYQAHRRGGLLLILDQFEEYIRLYPHPREQSFDEVISALVRDPRLSARILIAIREDRLADLDRFGGRIPQLLGNVLRLGPLSPTAALEAIKGPIERYAAWAREGRGGREVALETGLAEAVRDQLVVVSGTRHVDPAAAPSANGAGREPSVETAFLQLVMRQLWDEDVERAGGATLRLATLERLGGAEQIVATHVDGALSSLSSDEQDLAAEMLRFLVTPSGATACLTARDLSEYVERPEADIEALAVKLGHAPARILRGVAAAGGATGASGYELPQVLAEPALEWGTRHRTARLEARARRLVLALVGMTMVAIALVGYTLKPEPLQRLELASVDARFEVRGARPPDARIALVTLDDAVFKRLRDPPPLSRKPMADVLEAITDARPGAVAVDIIFNGRGPSASADDALIKAVLELLPERLVLATDRLDVEGNSQLFGREDVILDDSSAPAVGYAGFPRDPGDVARRIERDVALLPGAGSLDTLGVAAARIGGAVRPEQLPANAWIDYRGANGTYPHVAFDDILRGRPEALAKLRGRIVVIGNTAKDVPRPDALNTSAPGPSLMDGTEIQANAISTALDRLPLRDGGSALDLALIIVLGLLPAGLALRMRPALIVPACVVAAALFCVAAQLAFNGGRVIAVVFPLASLALSTIGVSAVLLLLSRHADRAKKTRATA